MPEPYWPKHSREGLRLSWSHQNLHLIRVRCAYCKTVRNYFPADLIQIFGDLEIDILMDRMTCEKGKHGRLDVRTFLPQGAEAVGVRIRRLVAIQIKRIPVWRDER